MDAKLQVIQELMEELMGEMEYGEEDFSERLGRKKPEMPEVGAIEIEAHGEIPEDEEGEPMVDEEMEVASPDNKLKERLLKLRG